MFYRLTNISFRKFVISNPKPSSWNNVQHIITRGHFMVFTISSHIFYNPNNTCSDGQILAWFVMNKDCNTYLVTLSYSAVFVALRPPNSFIQTLSSHLAVATIESEWNWKSRCSCCPSPTRPNNRDRDWILMGILFRWPTSWEDGAFVP